MILRWIIRGSFAIAVLILAGGGYLWFKLDGGFVPRTTLEALAARLEPAIAVSRPDPATFGPGPYPAVILLHGCGGLIRDGKRRPVTDTYAGLANEIGVLAITVDSFGPRGIDERTAIDQICSGWWMRGMERAGDVVAALAIAKQMTEVDPNRLAVAGWSHGSWAAMELLTIDFDEERPHGFTESVTNPLEGLRFMFLAYPHCGFPARTNARGWVEDVAAYAVLVENDTITPEEHCVAAFDRVNAEGGNVRVEMMTGATHAFDESDLVDHPRLRYNPKAAALSHALFQEGLRKFLIDSR